MNRLSVVTGKTANQGGKEAEMLPVVLAPANVQAPQAVDMSPIVRAPSDAALGRLPTHVVPQTVQGAKADEQRQQPQPRPQADTPPDTKLAKVVDFSALLQAGKGEIKLPAPFSTPFIAQLFGQLAADAPESAGIAAIWLGGGKQKALESAFSDFERMEQFGQVKYAPSGAKMLEPKSISAVAERGGVALLAPFRRTGGKQGGSLFQVGQAAYLSAQSRGLALAVAGGKEYNSRL